MYVVGDSAFGLSPCVMKIYSDPNLAPAQASLNYAPIRTRRVVECAIGKLKERFRVVAESNSKDPKLVSKVNMLCCAMHNIIERKETAYLPHYPNYAPQPLVAMNPSAASLFVHGQCSPPRLPRTQIHKHADAHGTHTHMHTTQTGNSSCKMPCKAVATVLQEVSCGTK